MPPSPQHSPKLHRSINCRETWWLAIRDRFACKQRRRIRTETAETNIARASYNQYFNHVSWFHYYISTRSRKKRRFELWRARQAIVAKVKVEEGKVEKKEIRLIYRGSRRHQLHDTRLDILTSATNSRAAGCEGNKNKLVSAFYNNEKRKTFYLCFFRGVFNLNFVWHNDWFAYG